MILHISVKRKVFAFALLLRQLGLKTVIANVKGIFEQ